MKSGTGVPKSCGDGQFSNNENSLDFILCDISAVAFIEKVRDASGMIFKDLLHHFPAFLAGGASVGGIVTAYFKIKEHRWQVQDRKRNAPCIAISFEKGSYCTNENGGSASVLVKMSNSGLRQTTLEGFDIDFEEKFRIDKKRVQAVWNATCDQVIKGQRQVCIRSGESLGATLVFEFPNTSFTLNKSELDTVLRLGFVDHPQIDIPIKLSRVEPATVSVRRRRSSFFDKRDSWVTSWSRF